MCAFMIADYAYVYICKNKSFSKLTPTTVIF